jgi:hypothetical protein
MYDFGNDCTAMGSGPKTHAESCNQAKYGSTEPPRYDLSKVTFPAAMFEGVCARALGLGTGG